HTSRRRVTMTALCSIAPARTPPPVPPTGAPAPPPPAPPPTRRPSTTQPWTRAPTDRKTPCPTPITLRPRRWCPREHPRGRALGRPVRQRTVARPRGPLALDPLRLAARALRPRG